MDKILKSTTSDRENIVFVYDSTIFFCTLLSQVERKYAVLEHSTSVSYPSKLETEKPKVQYASLEANDYSAGKIQKLSRIENLCGRVRLYGGTFPEKVWVTICTVRETKMSLKNTIKMVPVKTLYSMMN